MMDSRRVELSDPERNELTPARIVITTGAYVCADADVDHPVLRGGIAAVDDGRFFAYSELGTHSGTVHHRSVHHVSSDVAEAVRMLQRSLAAHDDYTASEPDMITPQQMLEVLADDRARAEQRAQDADLSSPFSLFGTIQAAAL